MSKEELRLATKLIEASTKKRFDIERYADTYNTKMRELIAAKVEGKEIVGPPEREEPPVINLMDALKQSLARVKEPKKTAAPRTSKPAAKRNAAGGAPRRAHSGDPLPFGATGYARAGRIAICRSYLQTSSTISASRAR